MQVIKQSKQALDKAIKIIGEGGAAVCATDTVYGFLADVSNKKAVEKIFRIKKRPKSKPLAVFVYSLKQAKELAQMDEEQEKYIRKYWPGKYTFILNAKPQIQKLKLLTKNKTVALRMPKDKFLLVLIKRVGKPLAQTSVNISGQPEMNKISDIINVFGGALPAGRQGKTQPDLIIDAGNLPKRKPSGIIDLTKNKIKYLRK